MAKLKRTSKTQDLVLQDYAQTLTDIKQRIQEVQVKASFAVNKELLLLYWSIGKTIAEKQESLGWGANVIEQLAKDLQNAFPGMKGFSRSNIFRMRSFYLAYSKIPQAVGQLPDVAIFRIPWGHVAVLLEKIKDEKQRLWYAEKAMEHGWSRSVMSFWIESNLHKRQGKAITNFKRTLPNPESDMAQQSFKDPYMIDFLTLTDDHLEKHVEQGLIDHIQKFLLELGQGFAFVGRQYHLEIGSKNYYIDLLFYHYKLKCFIVVEIKAHDFDPKDAGQINFYLAAVDDLVKSKDDNPTIGLLLCKTKDNITAEYALRNVSSPIGVAEYVSKIQESIPKALKTNLPTIEQIEAELEKQDLIAELEKPKKKKMDNQIEKKPSVKVAKKKA